jgi:phytoene dehydrogenase-like protein
MEANGRVAVVGAGLAGLTAAAVAARAGAQVTLFEQAREAGGRAQTLERDGVLLNIGPHALYRDRAAMRVFRELGVHWSGHRPRIGGYALLGGRRYKLPSGPAGLIVTGSLAARGKAEFARVYAGLRDIETRTLDTVPLAEWLAQTFRDASARRAFQAFVRVSTYGNAPALQSAGAVIDQMRGAAVEYLDGGWVTLIRELERVAVEAGVETRPCARVDGIEAAGGDWRVSAGGASETFEAVVLAIDPTNAARLAGGEVLDAWAAEARPVKAAVLDVVLSRLPNPKGNFALGFDRPTYLSVHSLSAQLAPAGQHLVTTAWYRGEDDPEDEVIERELERSLDLVQPGWREHLRYRRYLPGLVVTHDHVRAGTAGTTARPGPEVPGKPGLFVAGDWVGSEGMLADASVASGERAGSLAAAATRRAGSRATVVAAG